MFKRRRSLCTVLVTLALATAACATAEASPQATKPTVAPVLSTTTDPAPPTTPTSTTPATTTTIPNPHETLTASARSQVTSLIAYHAPNGEPIALPFRVPNPHQFGGPLTLMVTQGTFGDEWVKVQLPIRPNGTEAWIPTADYVLDSTLIRAEVDLATTSVKIFDNDVLIKETQAAIGAKKTPTPLGTFYVAAKRLNPPAEAHLGTWALVLSGFSEALPSFSGGLPVIAIHGSNNPELVVGRALSNGCVRVSNDVIQFLAENVPRGAPVVITSS